MKPYPEYKDSGIEWIGEIPEHWALNKVKHNFSFKTGFTPPSSKAEYYENGTHVWINISDLQEKEIHNSTNKITDKAIQDYNPEIVPKGSLLYSFKLSVGKVGFNTIDCYTNEAIFSIDPNGSANLNFFYYSLPEQIIKNANENIYGAKILNQELIKNAFLVAPPPAEQTAIANYLDRKTAEIDELIADKKRLLELYDEYKTAMISHVVTKGLDPTVEMKDSGIEWIGKIPEHWKIKKVKYLAKLKASSIDKKDNYEKKSLVVNYNDVIKNPIINDNIKLEHTSCKKSQFELFKLINGDLIITKDSMDVNNIADISRVENLSKDVVCGYHLYILRCNKKDSYYKYYYHCIGNKKIKNYLLNLSRGTTIIGISGESISNIKVPVPIISEQKEMSEYLDTINKTINKIIYKSNKSINLLDEYKKTLIHNAVTGKIDVRDYI